MHENQNPPTGLGAPAPVTSTENVLEFEAALRRFTDEFQPRGIVEETLVFQAAATAWRLRRLPYLESLLAETLLQSGSARKELEFLSRHEERLNRAYRRIVQDLKARHPLPSPGPARAADSRQAASPGAPPPPQPDYGYQAAAAPPSPAPAGSSPPAPQLALGRSRYEEDSAAMATITFAAITGSA